MAVNAAMSELTFPQRPEEYAQPTTNEVPVDHIPEFLLSLSNRECVMLENGSSTTLDPRLNEILLKFDWQYEKEDTRFDLDASVAYFTEELKMYDYIWWDDPKTKCSSAQFVSADNQTGDQSGPKERIAVQLEKVPDIVQFMIIAVSVYSKDHTMEDISELSIAVDTKNNHPVFNYKLPVASPARSFLLGVFVRQQASWQFQAIAEALLSRTISEIMHEPENLALISTIKPTPIKRRHVKLNFVEGKNLTPMDFSFLRKRSDPYLRIFIDNTMTVSEVSYSTLNPKIKCEPIDLGMVLESSTKVIEVQCWDYDRFTAHDSMGVHKFCIGGLLPKLQIGTNKVWLKLHPLEEHIRDKKKITGDILCDVVVAET